MNVLIRRVVLLTNTLKIAIALTRYIFHIALSKERDIL